MSRWRHHGVSSARRPGGSRSRAPLFLAWVLVLLLPRQGAAQAPVASTPHAFEVPLHFQPGVLELSSTIDLARSGDRFGPTHRLEAMPDDAILSQLSLQLGLRYAISARARVFLTLPLVAESLSNSGLETPVSSWGPGDVGASLERQLHSRRRPMSASTALLIHGQLPVGNDAPGPSGSRLLTGTGIPSAGLGLRHTRELLEPLILEASLLGILPFSQVVPYVENLETDGDGRFAPGPRLEGRLTARIEPRPRLGLELDLQASYHGQYRMGSTDEVVLPRLSLEPIEGSDGLFLQSGLALHLAVSRAWTLALGARYRFYGRTMPELAALGLEEFSPFPGGSAQLSARCRFGDVGAAE